MRRSRRSPFANLAFYRRPYSMSEQAMTAIGAEAGPSSPIGSSPLGWYHMMYPKEGSAVIDAGIDVPPFAPGTTEEGTAPRVGAFAASSYGGGGYSAPSSTTYQPPSGGGGGGGGLGLPSGLSLDSITSWAKANPIIIVAVVVILMLVFTKVI